MKVLCVKNSRKIIVFLKFVRIENSIISLFTVFVYSFLTFGEVKEPITLLILSTITMLSLSAGNIINDIFDIKIDRINRPERPLPSGIISVQSAKYMYSFFTLIALMLSLYFNEFVILLVLFNTILLFLYSHYFKQKILIGNFTVSYLTMSVLILCGFAFDNFNQIILPCLFAFFANFMRELVKDLEDADGDKALNLQTFALMYSLKKNKGLILFLGVLLVLASYIPIFLHDVSDLYWMLIHMGIIGPVFYILFLISKAEKKTHFSTISSYLKGFMLLGLLILITVKNDITISL